MSQRLFSPKVLLKVVLTLPWALYFLPAIVLVLAVSVHPVFLGRYSAGLVWLNIVNACVFVVFIYSLKKGRYALMQLLDLALVFLSFIVAGNNAVNNLGFISAYLVLIRFCAAASVIILAFLRSREAPGGSAGIWLGLGMLVVLWVLADSLLLFYVNMIRPEKSSLLSAYRQQVDLSGIGARDIVIIGDSFVWGQGVGQDQTFCAQLEKIARPGSGLTVYNLGVVGAGLPEYIRIVSSIPPQAKADHLVLCFYLNDMPPVPDFPMRLQSFLRGSKKSSLALGVIEDALLKKVMCQDVECYHRLLVRSFDKNQPTFGQRWDVLLQRLRRFYELALRHSGHAPEFVIIPVMTDFEDYPLEQAHNDIAGAAAAMGYSVIDLLPVFRRQLKDGVGHRAGPNDNHFDAVTHLLTAQVLNEELFRKQSKERQ